MAGRSRQLNRLPLGATTTRFLRDHCQARNFPLRRERRTTCKGTSASGARREKAALSSGCKSHPANAPAGSNRSSHGGDEMAEAFVAGHA